MKKMILLLLATGTIYAGGIFSIGHKNVGFTVGTDDSFGNTYTVLGASVNYFVLDNISVGAAFQTYLGDDPTINQITVPVTYHLPLENTTYRPYLGAFYNHTFMGDTDTVKYEDYDLFGGRIGVSMQTSANSYISFGWVQEFSTNTSDDIDSHGYPEFSGGLSF